MMLRNVPAARRNAMTCRLGICGEICGGICGALVVTLVSATASAQNKPDAKDMTLLGYDDLQGRSAYQPTIHAQNGRWIAYIGHHGGTEAESKPLNPLTGQHEFNGTSLIDVTDPHHSSTENMTPIYYKRLMSAPSTSAIPITRKRSRITSRR